MLGFLSRTTPYHPRGNPVERFNRTLLDLLGTLEDKRKEEWRKYVRPLVHAYNCTKNDATGEAPFLLMFGREPRLPIDLCFGISSQGHNSKTHSQYVRDLKKRLRHAYELASRNAEKRQLLNKRRWDAKVTALPLEVGDRVLVRNLSLRKKHKISDKWESTVHVVVKQPDENIPVYVVKADTGEGRERVLHRDMLLPCGFLPANLGTDSGIDTEQATPTQVPMTTNEGNIEETLSTEDVEEDWEAQYTTPQSLEGDIRAEQCVARSQSPLDPEAPEFISDQPDLSDTETVGSPAPTQGRPQRRRVPPTYLSDYQVGYKAHCKQHGLCPPTQQTLFHGFLMSLQQQIAGLVQSLSSGSDGDVTF